MALRWDAWDFAVCLDMDGDEDIWRSSSVLSRMILNMQRSSAK